ncbi:MAG: aminopeptidase [Cyclobacteriaceae bacterium]|nr:aminopeptidase [Cyclobacteriaceae bacterium]
MRKKIFGIVLICLIAFGVWNHELLIYGFGQAKGQAKIIWYAKHVEHFLNDPDFPDSLKNKLALVEQIRQFAFDSLGLSHSENYTTLYDQKGEELMWVVTACEPFKLVAKTWTFPLIGEFSYKGYFSKDKAYRLKASLEAEGYDTGIGNPGGWSTLGYLKDPILSGMLYRSEGSLAELIIHELTHGTLFIKDSLRFNENLATVVGIRGARQFLQHKFGPDSRPFLRYEHQWHDRRLFTQHILRATSQLDSLYMKMNQDDAFDSKNQKKQTFFKQVIENMDTLGLINLDGYRRLLNSEELNNTFFMSYVRYRADYEEMEQILIHRYNDDIKSFINAYKKQTESINR